MVAIVQENLTIRRGRPSLDAMTPLGRLIQNRRKALGWTLAELSFRTGVLPQTINAIERGVSRQPRYETLHKIAFALGVSVEEMAAAAYSDEPELVPAAV
jgi:transcriptional regulator with XRE-family HTH domain